MSTISYVVGFVVETAVRFAPVFLVSITLAVIARSLPVAAVATRWLARREHTSVVAGSAVGAFSPFCSCTVVPVVRSLLVAGAPLAGVMAFWVASPIMDPEIFLFTVAVLGRDLAVARLLAALALSLLAGGGAIVAVRRGWLPTGRAVRGSDRARASVAPVGAATVASVAPVGAATVASVAPVVVAVGGGSAPGVSQSVALRSPAGVARSCSVEPMPADDRGDAATSPAPAPGATCGTPPVTDVGVGFLGSLRAIEWRRVGRDVADESWRMGRWLLLAFALEALILRFVPQEAMVGVLGSDAPWAVPLAALLGVPLYLDNLSALPVIAGLLEQGMTPGAAVAFLLAGPVTTIPAMTAVRAVMPGEVFRYYLVVCLGGSVLLGMVAQFALG